MNEETLEKFERELAEVESRIKQGDKSPDIEKKLVAIIKKLKA